MMLSAIARESCAPMIASSNEQVVLCGMMMSFSTNGASYVVSFVFGGISTLTGRANNNAVITRTSTTEKMLVIMILSLHVLGTCLMQVPLSPPTP